MTISLSRHVEFWGSVAGRSWRRDGFFRSSALLVCRIFGFLVPKSVLFMARKSEYRNPKQIRMTENLNPAGPRILTFGIWLFRISTFVPRSRGIRVSGLSGLGRHAISSRMEGRPNRFWFQHRHPCPRPPFDVPARNRRHELNLDCFSD